MLKKLKIYKRAFFEIFGEWLFAILTFPFLQTGIFPLASGLQEALERQEEIDLSFQGEQKSAIEDNHISIVRAKFQV